MDVERMPAGEDWRRAVLRSIGVMRADLGSEHSLQTLARSAWLSPFHFHRIFQRITDSTPARFLAASRMAEAKRLLVQTDLSVTDICMRIGYSSLGTFTSQFTRMVGMSPGRFRRLATETADRPFHDVLAALVDDESPNDGRRVPAAVTGVPDSRPPVAAAVTGTPGGRSHLAAAVTRVVGSRPQVVAPVTGNAGPPQVVAPVTGNAGPPQVAVSVVGGPGEPALCAVGLFDSGIPQRNPQACAVLAVPGTHLFTALPDGDFHALAMCFPDSVMVAEAVAGTDPSRCFVAAHDRPVRVRNGQADPDAVRLELRPHRDTDPPLVLALPLLMAAQPAVKPAA